MAFPILGIIKICFTFTFINLLLLIILFGLLQLIYLKLRKKEKIPGIKIVTFIHPNSADMGGGEKVLWCMLNSLINKTISEHDDPIYSSNKLQIKIITAGNIDAEIIKNKLKNTFNIDFFNARRSNFVNSIELVRIKTDFLLKPKSFATMILQILGQIIFSFEIIIKSYSDAYIDTTGLPFTYFILNFFGHAKVSAYVHYPFISDDMINDIKMNREGVHSRGIVSKIPFLKPVKIFYYRAIYYLYRINGNQVSYALCNSTWTLKHMQLIWRNTQLNLLHPPCNTSAFQEIANNHVRENIIVSFAQFRPEKNHRLQIKIMLDLLKKGNVPRDTELHMIGGVRNEIDDTYFNQLKYEIKSLGLEKNIKMIKNAPFAQVKEEFRNAKIGIHTMKDEHFGISVVEMMAAGLIVIAHRSAGAKLDIIDPAVNIVGITVLNDNDYAIQIAQILNDYDNVSRKIAPYAIERANLFGDENFQKNFSFLFKKMI